MIFRPLLPLCGLGLLLTLSGCSVQPEAPATERSTPSEVDETPSPNPRNGNVSSWEAPSLPEGVVPQLHFETRGFSPTYTSYLRNAEALDGLARDLGRALGVSSLAVEATWNERDKAGTLTLFVPETDRRGEAIADQVGRSAAVDLSSLQPLMGALGRYRATLGGRFDLRFLSFGLSLAFWNRGTGLHCTISGDLNDPQGSRLGPCFRCLDPRQGAVDICRQGEAWPAPVAADGPSRRSLVDALLSDPL